MFSKKRGYGMMADNNQIKGHNAKWRAMGCQSQKQRKNVHAIGQTVLLFSVLVRLD